MRAGMILVVGYGNDLRGDDAAGQHAAARVAAWALPGVEVHALHQLTPELADPLAAADRAIFLDAHPAPNGAGIRVRRLRPAGSTPRLAHTCDPPGLLALARDAFGRWPEAWWVTIPAAEFVFGAPLSPLAERGVGDALETVRRLLASSPAPTRTVRRSRRATDATRRHRRITGCPTR
jgi:hydrogenase maturation protease